MDKIKIIGGNRLNGQIYISGAKNAALPLICASLLTDETVTLTNMPMLSDIRSMNALLEQMGTQIDSFDDFVDGHATKTYSYRTQKFSSLIAPYDYVRKMRASYYVLGPVLAREGHVELSLPGGCAIGARPMDIHLSSLEQMGATIEIKNGYVHADIKGRLKGAHITFHTASVGATCNILMAATLAEGETVIENAAKEPEIGDLIDLLTAMGAKIEGRDSSKLTIRAWTSCTVRSIKLSPTGLKPVPMPLPRQLPTDGWNSSTLRHLRCGLRLKFCGRWGSAWKKAKTAC